MFFFIGGVQPRTVSLDDRLRMCPSCGLYQARLKRIDHYFALFFIPLFRVKKGTPFLECGRCGTVPGEESGEASRPEPERPVRCPSCGHSLEPDFQYCPGCGRRVR